MKPLIAILLIISLCSPAFGQSFDAPPKPLPEAVAARMVTVSWYPGTLKGYSQTETQRIIIEAMQQWQSVSGVQFGTLPAGNATDITIYPYTQANPPWAMATYPSTGQILYATTKKFERDWAVTAFAHEIGHCFGWGHADTSRLESLMHPKGSSVRYFDVTDAKRARNQFGLSTVGYHWPYSLKFVGDKIRDQRKAFDAAKAEYAKHDKRWGEYDRTFKHYRDLLKTTTDPKLRAEYDSKRKYSLDARDVVGKERKRANDKLAASSKRLVPLSQQWQRIKKEWDSINGIVVPMASVMESEPCSCFHDESRAELRTVNLKDLFRDLPKDTQPLTELAN